MKPKVTSVKGSRSKSRESNTPKYIRVSKATYDKILTQQKKMIAKKKRHVPLIEVLSELIK